MTKSSLTLRAASELSPQVQRVFTRVSAQLRGLLPDSEIEHIGATAIPEALTKGDLDIMVRVAPAAFQTATKILGAHFTIKQPENWTPHFASFGDDVRYELPLGVQLVAKDSEGDIFIFLRDYLLSNPTALTEYNRLKVQNAPDGPDAYWKAKDAFFSKILAAREK